MNSVPASISYDWGERLPTLRTPRLDLRWIELAEAPEMFAIYSHPEVVRYWDGPGVPDLPKATAMIEDIHRLFHARVLFQWGIARRDTGRLIGGCTLFQMELKHRRGTIGYAVGREHWGQGYAQEAITALLDFAFDALDFHRIEADVDPRNARSLRLLEKLGFRREGEMRERYFVRDEIQDSAWYGLLARDWRRGARRRATTTA